VKRKKRRRNEMKLSEERKKKISAYGGRRRENKPKMKLGVKARIGMKKSSCRREENRKRNQ